MNKNIMLSVVVYTLMVVFLAGFAILLNSYSKDMDCATLAKELNDSQGTRVGGNCIVTYRTGHKVVIKL